MAHDEGDATFFPRKLMSILADPLNQEAISWLPEGDAFVIHDGDRFVEAVLPNYFPRQAKFSSFTRKLNRWYVVVKEENASALFAFCQPRAFCSFRHFTRVTYGPNSGAFFHKFFQRDQPHLLAQMFCKNARNMWALEEHLPVTIEQKIPPMLLSSKDVAPITLLQALPTIQSMHFGAPSRMIGTSYSGRTNFPEQTLETVKSLLVEREWKLQQEQRRRQERFLHVQRMMIVALHQHRWQQEHKLYPSPSILPSGMVPGRHRDPRPNPRRASAA